MRIILSVLSLVAVSALAILLHHFGVPLAALATGVAGIVCLGWLVAIVVLPWNLYFRARHLAFELERSEQRGIVVEAKQKLEAKQIQTRMLRVSVGLHLGSAALLALGAKWYAQPLGFVFAGLFLLSTFFRPGVEYYRFLSSRLSDALREANYPRADVQELIAQVKQLMHDRDAQGHALSRLREEHQALSRRTETANQELQRRIATVARTFDDTVSRLTDNQEIISGIKAFLRLVQSAPPTP